MRDDGFMKGHTFWGLDSILFVLDSLFEVLCSLIEVNLGIFAGNRQGHRLNNKDTLGEWSSLVPCSAYSIYLAKSCL